MIRIGSSHNPLTARSAGAALISFRSNDAPAADQPNVHAPRPDPEPNPEPDSAVHGQLPDISPADWDILFNAVVARLEACTGPAPLEQLPEHVPAHVKGVIQSLQATVRECAESMRLLVAALPRKQQQRRRPE